MEEDEDMVMIIVGDDANDADPKEIKQEVKNEMDGNESVEEFDNEIDIGNVEDLIEAAEKYGEMIPVDFIKRENNDDDSKSDFHLDSDERSEYLEDFSSTDEEFIVKKTVKKRKKNAKTIRRVGKSKRKRAYKEVEYMDRPVSNKDIANDPRRRRMLRSHERKSYVRTLINDNPVLGRNEQLLIKAIVHKMVKTKPPAPPDDYFRVDDKDPFNDKTIQCSSCPQRFHTVPEVGRHFQQMHGLRYLMCLACGVTFRDITNLYKHEKRCIAPDAEVVLKARAVAIGPKGRARPFMQPTTKHVSKPKPVQPEGPRNKRFLCNHCPAKFATKLALDGHENMHKGERPYRCEHCLAPYASYSALARHRLIHNDEVHQCNLCGRICKTKYTLRVHQQTHEAVRKYLCPECPKRFAQNSAMLLHIRRQHLQLPPPCACQICPKRFGRNSVLKLHMRKEHGLELITRNMFIKSMSRLTEMELEQAKVVMKSEVDEFPEIVVARGKDVVPVSKRDKAAVTKISHVQIVNMKAKQTKEAEKEKSVTSSCDDNDIEEINGPNSDSNENANSDSNENENSNSNENDTQEENVYEPIEIKKEIAKGANQIIVDISETDLSSDVLQFVHKLQIDATAEGREIKIVLMDKGRVVHLVDSESDAQKLLEQFESNEDGEGDVQNMAIVSEYSGQIIDSEGVSYVFECEQKYVAPDNDTVEEI